MDAKEIKCRSSNYFSPMNPRRKHGINRSSGKIYFQKAGNLLARTNDVLKQAFALDAANEQTGITRNNELTVAGGLTNTPTSLSINGQGAGIYNDKTFAASGVSLNDGMNTFTAIMVTAGSSFTNSTTKTLPASVSLTYDGNGNLIYDGQKAYQYDCPNELTSVTVSNSWRNEYVYDGFGRRRVAKNYVWYGGTWQEGAEKRYVYDGNNVIQERDGNNTVLVSYTRGTDLSGTMQDAGGIGGLLARTDVNGSAFYHADGNGNITMMIDSSGNQLAKYLYDSFGNAIGMWGTLASVNTYRFSSKEIDTHSGLYYYDARYYDPNYQRWPNRDPIQENGGLNLYGYVANNPINRIDLFGLADILLFTGPVTVGAGGGTYSAADLNYAVAVIYGEARNNPTDQYAVASVLWNRIGATGVRGGIANSFTGVATAPHQFACVSSENPRDRKKFEQAGSTKQGDWSDADAAEYNGAYNQLKQLLGDSSGPGATYNFNMYLAYPATGYTQLVPGGNYYYNNPGIKGPHNN